ncbi:hypothetical protein PUNSTDRAFT_116967 [Punctularia strigosozonata HHB-11173 SS5]|uniref:FAD-binding FR-type domain-containing protein n=1 Tax=Punctularia strigosozonata (strain HHB-11173) TaxID=741275 RepID=R7S008_PUNST|nr:uncharacterized protein PUNSTDRAFT_116967 [Punctularia strigosozonata HHB-11173 SS5]EIN03568.1 hypothetical protein PUNSTDRAFT_116967 [Punctularia strigosozonata HHB-11173 SS5]
MSGTPPVIPTELQVYNSYVEDPKWQRKFSIIWGTAAGIAILISLPHLLRAIRSRRAFAGLFGVWEDWSGKAYQPVAASDERKRSGGSPGWKDRVRGVARIVTSALLWTLPGTEVDVGQMLIIIGYLVTVLVCITMKSELISNPNRAGFLALAQFPVVFLFATKNSLLSLLLGPGNGYEKLNYVHKWAGRGMFIGAVVHGALWIRNHLQYGLPILGQQKETSGVAALGVLCVIVLTSFRSIRRLCWNLFFVVHVLAFVAFYVTVCYHTIYARPWVYPPLAFYGLDLLMRLLRFRIKDATLIPVDHAMTIINVHDCSGGWVAGQHVRLRAFVSGRLFESHPLTIMRAPPSTSCLSPSSARGTLTLGARAVGDWSRELNAYARAERDRTSKGKELDGIDTTDLGADVQVMIDGPYGGCSVDLGEFESVLLVAGGSGATFTLGMLDDIVGRCVRLGRPNGERTKRIKFAWCIKSFGAIEWFAQPLMEIAAVAATPGSGLDLHVSVFVTCLCNPEAVPPIPNSDVRVGRPSIHKMLRDFVTPPCAPCADSVAKGASCCCAPDTAGTSTLSTASASQPGVLSASEKAAETKLEVEEEERFATECDCEAGDFDVPGLRWVGLGGGVAVCASGPERLTREAKNAVARIGMARSVALGGIALHTELFSL